MPPEIEHKPEYEPKEPKLIFLAHVDIVHPHVRFVESDDRQSISGTLDNMGPAAILYSLVGQLKAKAFFTENEETSMKDARRIASWIEKKYHPPKNIHKYHRDRSWLPTVCILEATYLNPTADVSVENLVLVDVRRIKKALDIPSMKDVSYAIAPTGGWDESWIMMDKKIPCFSLCLPTSGTMHTFDCSVPVSKIGKFRRAISAIDKAFA